jgi:hypothetical protein
MARLMLAKSGQSPRTGFQIACTVIGDMRALKSTIVELRGW